MSTLSTPHSAVCYTTPPSVRFFSRISICNGRKPPYSSICVDLRGLLICGKADLGKGCWNPKRKLGVTTHFSEIIESLNLERKCHTLSMAGLCCVCCVVFCCVVPGCVALSCVCCVALRWAGLCCVALRCVASGCVLLYCVALHCVALCCALLCYVELCCLQVISSISCYVNVDKLNQRHSLVHNLHISTQLAKVGFITSTKDYSV